jgi:hypothetical protein
MAASGFASSLAGSIKLSVPGAAQARIIPPFKVRHGFCLLSETLYTPLALGKAPPMNKQQLAAKIWESANQMRSKIEANEYKDYILGFIFYKYLSDQLCNLCATKV